MSEWVIYHNSKCGTCRGTLELLEQKGIHPKVISYLETPLSEDELKTLLKKLQLRPKDIVRTKEEDFKSAQVDLEDDATVIRLLSQNPRWIQRPIVVRGERAVIGRPPENALKLL